jgi:hypothetical protein
MSVDQTEILRVKLQDSLNTLIGKIGRKVQIGTKEQFPLGWRKAAKGRTVWRILEELITQNLEKYYGELGMVNITASDSEVTVYDFSVLFEGEDKPAYVNIKSAVSGGKVQKDDISKGEGLREFYEEDVNREFFVATFFIIFNDDMTIEIEKCVVFPIAWIPDVYVNPSNNANLQSSKYKNVDDAVKRTPGEFYEVFKTEMQNAKEKKQQKLAGEPKAKRLTKRARSKRN